MKWLDALLGRTKPVKSQVESLFAITTAYVTLQTRFGLKSTGQAGLCFRPVTSSYFEQAEDEVRDILKIGSRETGTKVESATDSYGFQWLLLADDEFEDLVASMHIVSQTLADHGFGEQMLAAIFAFRDEEGKLAYWLYNYKRGNFYPFAPLPEKRRDTAYELRLRAVMEQEMPIEKELERWYPMWDVPLSRE